MLEFKTNYLWGEVHKDLDDVLDDLSHDLHLLLLEVNLVGLGKGYLVAQLLQVFHQCYQLLGLTEDYHSELLLRCAIGHTKKNKRCLFLKGFEGIIWEFGILHSVFNV